MEKQFPQSCNEKGLIWVEGLGVQLWQVGWLLNLMYQYQIAGKAIMRLRHKKPINSYIGQANHDSSSAHDEDFEKNQTPCRKYKFVKPKPVPEQTKKYAEILSEFVAVVNQNYRSHLADSGVPAHKCERGNLPPQLSEKPKNILQTHADKKTEVVSKQQQNIRKPQSVAHRLPPSTKFIRKEKRPVEEPIKRKQIRPQMIQKPPPVQPLPQPKISQPKTIDLTDAQKSKVADAQKTKITGSSQGQNPMMNPFINGMNSGMFNPMLQFMMSYPNMMQQKPEGNTTFPNQLQFQNMLNLMSMNAFGLQNMQGHSNSQHAPNMQQNLQAFANMMNNYIPFNKLPFVQQDGKIPQPTPQQPSQESYQQVKPQAKIQPANTSTANQNSIARPQTPKAATPSIIPATIAVNGNLPRLGDQKLPDFNRRASHHVSIAYNIHFHNLKNQGVIGKEFSQLPNSKNLTLLDPTYAAKKVRDRKSSDIVANNMSEFTSS